MHVIPIALSQVRGFIAFVLVFLVFWAKLCREEEWMRFQFERRMPPMLIRLPPQCPTFSDRYLTIPLRRISPRQSSSYQHPRGQQSTIQFDR
jgi:hypothetical protein